MSREGNQKRGKMSLSRLLHCGFREKTYLGCQDEGVYGKSCRGWKQNEEALATIVSRGAVVMPMTSTYQAPDTKLSQALKEVLAARPVFFDPHHVTLVCMGSTAGFCRRVSVCATDSPTLFDMSEVTVTSLTVFLSDEEWLEVIGHLLQIIRLRLVSQAATDQHSPLFLVMDLANTLQPLKFDPSQQTTLRCKRFKRKSGSCTMEDLLSVLLSPYVTVLAVNQSQNIHKDTGRTQLDSIFLDESSVDVDTLTALNLDFYTHKVRIGIISFQCVCLLLPQQGEINRENVYEALVASGHPAVASFYGDGSQPVWAVTGGSFRHFKMCGIGEFRVRFASELLAGDLRSVSLLKHADTHFTSVRSSLIVDEYRQLTLSEQGRAAELIRAGVFAVDDKLRYLFSVCRINKDSKEVSLFVGKQEDNSFSVDLVLDETEIHPVSVFRTCIKNIRCANSNKSGIPANALIDNLAKLNLLRVLQVDAEKMVGWNGISPYKPMLAVDTPWLTIASRPSINEEHKRHIFPSCRQSFAHAAQETAPRRSQANDANRLNLTVAGFLREATILGFSASEQTALVHHWNYDAIDMFGLLFEISFATVKYGNLELPGYALTFSHSTPRSLIEYILIFSFPHADKIADFDWEISSSRLTRASADDFLFKTWPGLVFTPCKPRTTAKVSAAMPLSPTSPASPKTDESETSTEEATRRRSSSSCASHVMGNPTCHADVCQAPATEQSCESPVLLNCSPAIKPDIAALPALEASESIQLPISLQLSPAVDAVLPPSPRESVSPCHSASIRPATILAAVHVSPSSRSSPKSEEGGTITDECTRRRSSSSAVGVQVQMEHLCESTCHLGPTGLGDPRPGSVGARPKKGKWRSLVSRIKRAFTGASSCFRTNPSATLD